MSWLDVPELKTDHPTLILFVSLETTIASFDYFYLTLLKRRMGSCPIDLVDSQSCYPSHLYYFLISLKENSYSNFEINYNFYS